MSQRTTNSKTCVTRKDSAQPVHPPSMAKVLVYPSLDSLETVKDTCDQRRLCSETHNQNVMKQSKGLCDDLELNYNERIKRARVHKESVQLNVDICHTTCRSVF